MVIATHAKFVNDHKNGLYSSNTEAAAEARFKSMDKFLTDHNINIPIHHARIYLECIENNGAKGKLCKKFKERWLNMKAAQNGNKFTWNEDDIHRMLKEDAIKAGYQEEFKLFSACAIKCHDEYGDATKEFKKCWLGCKVAHNIS